MCLECGARLALDYRRPRGWKPAAAVIGAVLLVAAAAFAITLIAVDDDSKQEVAATKAGREATAKPRKAAKRAPASPRPSRSGVPGWPKGRDGFTVVLVSGADRAGAREIALRARRRGVDAGLLRSNDYSSLSPGFWIVFAGVYKTSAQAQRAARKLSKRFSGAFPQFVNGAGRR